MGTAAFRLIASSVSELVFGSAGPDPVAGPAGFAEAGQRAFADVTPLFRSRVGRTLMPRVSSWM